MTAGTAAKFWHDEFKAVRDDRDEWIQRKLEQEERAEQGLLRESRMDNALMALLCIGITERIVVEDGIEGRPAGTQILNCNGCQAFTYEGDPEQIIHDKTCPVALGLKIAYECRELRGDIRPTRRPGELVFLRQAVIAMGGLNNLLAECPSCGAERTNGEMHAGWCPLVTLAQVREEMKRGS